MSECYVNGTCANCKSRFRFNAEQILEETEITCPHCGCVLDPTKIKEGARDLLGRARIRVLNTCVQCGTLFPLNNQLTGLALVLCNECSKHPSHRKIKERIDRINGRE